MSAALAYTFTETWLTGVAVIQIILQKSRISCFLDRAGITDPDDRKLVMNELFQSVEWAQMDLGVLT